MNSVFPAKAILIALGWLLAGIAIRIFVWLGVTVGATIATLWFLDPTWWPLTTLITGLGFLPALGVVLRRKSYLAYLALGAFLAVSIATILVFSGSGKTIAVLWAFVITVFFTAVVWILSRPFVHKKGEDND